jgi:succinate dehydrogenase / fumarate reductase membrane anchor subunit
MSGSSGNMETPLKRVRGLGSAREGTTHFWRQRITGLALVPLTLFFVGLVVALNGADYASTRAALATPFVAMVFALMVIAGLYHMRLGMQVIVEDYVHNEGAKLVWLMLNTFFTVAVGAMALFALLKIAFGG